MSCIQEQPTEGVCPKCQGNRQIRQSNTDRTVGNVESHPPSRIWASSQFRKRLPSTSVRGLSGNPGLYSEKDDAKCLTNVINGMHAKFNSQQYATKGTIRL